jgi:hypothetical protein
MKTAENGIIDCPSLEFVEKSKVLEASPDKIDVWKEDTILLDINTLRHMSSGTCIILRCQSSFAVCKEGDTIKIFRINARETLSNSPEEIVAILRE